MEFAVKTMSFSSREQRMLLNLLTNRRNGLYQRMPEGGTPHAIATREQLKEEIADLDALIKRFS